MIRVPIIFGNPDAGLEQKIFIDGDEVANLKTKESILIWLVGERRAEVDSVVINLLNGNVINIISNQCSIRTFLKVMDITEYDNKLDVHYSFGKVGLEIIKKFESKIRVHSEPYGSFYDVQESETFEVFQYCTSNEVGSGLDVFQIYLSTIEGVLYVESFGNEIQCRNVLQT